MNCIPSVFNLYSVGVKSEEIILLSNDSAKINIKFLFLYIPVYSFCSVGCLFLKKLFSVMIFSSVVFSFNLSKSISVILYVLSSFNTVDCSFNVIVSLKLAIVLYSSTPTFVVKPKLFVSKIGWFTLKYKL